MYLRLVFGFIFLLTSDGGALDGALYFFVFSLPSNLVFPFTPQSVSQSLLCLMYVISICRNTWNYPVYVHMHKSPNPSVSLFVLYPFPSHRQTHTCTVLHTASPKPSVRFKFWSLWGTPNCPKFVTFWCQWVLNALDCILMSGLWCALSLPTEFIDGVELLRDIKFTCWVLADFSVEFCWPQRYVASICFLYSMYVYHWTLKQ